MGGITMEWASIAIGFGGLLLGALTTVLSYLNQRDERKHVYRQALYNKQVEGCEKISKLALEYHSKVLLLLMKHEIDPKNVPLVEHDVRKAERQFMHTAGHWLVFLPQSVNEATEDFGIAAYELESLAGKSDAAEINEHKRKTNEAWEELVSSIRKTLGTEPLSSETIRILSSPTKDSGAPVGEEHLQKYKAS
jgi:hypothetical protein